MKHLDTYPTFELMVMIERAYVHQNWEEYDQIFEELRERGTFAEIMK